MVEGFCAVVCVWRRVGGFLTAPSRPQAAAAVRAHRTRFLHRDQGLPTHILLMGDAICKETLQTIV